MKTSNLTLYCAGIETLGAPSYSARKLGDVAVELKGVNLSAVIEEMLNGVDADFILDEIGADKIKAYMESLGWTLKEDE